MMGHCKHTPTHPHSHTHTLRKQHVMVRMWRNWDLYVHLVGIFSGVAAVKKPDGGSSKMTNRNTLIQQSHIGVYHQKNWKQDLKERFAHSCSQLCYSE